MYKINEIVNRALLVGDESMPEMYLKKSWFTYKNVTAVSYNVCFDVLNDIVDKYNNTYHKTTKSLLMLNLIFILNAMLILMKKILSWK